MVCVPGGRPRGILNRAAAQSRETSGRLLGILLWAEGGDAVVSPPRQKNYLVRGRRARGRQGATSEEDVGEVEAGGVLGLASPWVTLAGLVLPAFAYYRHIRQSKGSVATLDEPGSRCSSGAPCPMP